MSSYHSILIDRGYAKGFKLFIESNSTTQPTKSIVKKSLFDTLGNLRGYIFCDCFCGSGQIGLQAASMGADSVLFFEKDPSSYKNLLRNINNFNHRFNNFVGKLNVYNMDFFNSRDVICAKNNLIMYFDSPFDIRPGFSTIYHDISDFIDSFDIGINKKIDIIIVEMRTGASINMRYFDVFRTKKFGKTTLKYFLRRDNGRRS